ncbi:MAG: succinate dehydrogenase/fumarate reductase iron-sulfur subunit [Candidatus Heimdallarchaeota archaeon]|nr:succinate dehydrogenase/fumarate reductase iron-sulfur subunit [Candidatus Heimdallarchaeota archaeon]
MSEEKYKQKFSVQRGTDTQNIKMHDYEIDVDNKMVVLDALILVQANHEPDLSIRWNCKAGKCGSCSAEINGKPKLLCMSKLSDFSKNETIIVKPMHTFPLIKDLVTDVSWNYKVNKKIKPFVLPEGQEDTRMMQSEVNRVQEFRKCIECFLCQDVCHVLRSHQRFDSFAGPRFMTRLASLEFHPLNTIDRIPDIKNEFGSGFCNITKCCTEVCPESIPITDEAIIPLKEKVVDRYYDPLQWLIRKIFVRK